MVTFLQFKFCHSNEFSDKHSFLFGCLKSAVLVSTIGISTLSIFPTAANAASPSAERDKATLTKTMDQIWIDVLANDKNLRNTPLTLSIVSQPANGKVNTTSENKIRYIPNPGFVGQDRFFYKVKDKKGATSRAAVTIEVEGKVVLAPIAKSDMVSLDKGKNQIWIDVLANDKNLRNTPLTLSIVSQPANGKVNTTSKNKIRYIPNPGFVGQDNFLYKIQDKAGQQAVATVVMSVLGSNSDLDNPPSKNNMQVNLTWDSVPYPVQGYNVYFGPTSGMLNQHLSELSVDLDELDKAKLSVNYNVEKDLQLTSGEMVCFGVEAYNDFGKSELSDPVCKVVP